MNFKLEINFLAAYLRGKGLQNPCLRSFEVPSLLGYGPSHCTLILKQAGSEYLILDPDCKYSEVLISEELENFIRMHESKIIKIEKSSFVSDILLGRTDSFDDLNRLVISTKISIRSESVRRQLAIDEFPSKSEPEEEKT